MRPIQSLLLILVLLACGVAAFFVLRGGEGGPQGIAGSVDIRDLGKESEALQPGSDPADLVSPGEGADLAAEAGRSALTDPDAKPLSSRSGLAAERILSGRVVNSAGRGISEAEVFVADAIGNMGFVAIDLSAPGKNELGWMKRKSVLTDQEGRFTLESPKGASAQIAIRAGGFAPLDDQVALSSTESTDLGTLELEDGVILAGRVLDEAGIPVEGVTLRAQATDGASGTITIFAGESGRYLTETDAGGRFRVDKLRTGPFRIRFLHDDYPTETLDGTAPRPGLHRSDYLIEFGSSFSIEGIVTGLPEKLPEPIRVSATPIQSGAASEVTSAQATKRSGSLQQDGRFRVGGLIPDVEYNVSLRKGRGSWQGERLTGTVRGMAGDNDLVLEWRVDAAIELRAVNAVTGDAIEEFEMLAGIDWKRSLSGEDGRPLLRHPDGRARFAGLHPREGADRVSVRIDAVGYEPWERQGLKIAEGEQLKLGDVALTPVPLLTVKVLGAKDGTPIRRAWVTLTELKTGSDGRNATPASASTATEDLDEALDHIEDSEEQKQTDEQGLCRFSARPGKTVQVSVDHSKYAAATSEPLVFASSGGGDMEWTARLTRGGSVLLTAKDTNGKPLVGRPIQHLLPGDSTNASSLDSAFSSRKTDEAGVVHYEHLAAGTHRFRVGEDAAGGMVMVGGSTAYLSFSSPGSRGSEGDEANRPWSEVTVLEGMESTVEVVGPALISTFGLVTEEGAPLVGATVRLLKEESDDDYSDPFSGMSSPSGRTSSDGTWSVEGLEPGDYELRIIHHTRHQPAVFDVVLVEGENDLGTVNLPVSIIEGRVLSGGEPVVGAQVRASIGEGKDASTVRSVTRVSFSDGGNSVMTGMGGDAEGVVRTDEYGAYRLRGVEPDRNLFVHVEADGFRSLRSDLIRLSPGELQTDFDLELRAGGTLETEVVQADGTASVFAVVSALYTGQEQGVLPVTAIADSSGKAVLKGLAPGAWVVSARDINDPGEASSGSDRPEKTIEIAPGETASMRLEMSN